ISVSHTADGANDWNIASPVSVSVTVSDDTSGLGGAPDCLVGGSTATVTGSSSPYSVSVSGEGSHSVSCSVADNAGNTNSDDDTVKIDTVNPTGSLDINSGAT